MFNTSTRNEKFVEILRSCGSGIFNWKWKKSLPIWPEHWTAFLFYSRKDVISLPFSLAGCSKVFSTVWNIVKWPDSTERNLRFFRHIVSVKISTIISVLLEIVLNKLSLFFCNEWIFCEDLRAFFMLTKKRKESLFCLAIGQPWQEIPLRRIKVADTEELKERKKCKMCEKFKCPSLYEERAFGFFINIPQS